MMTIPRWIAVAPDKRLGGVLGSGQFRNPQLRLFDRHREIAWWMNRLLAFRIGRVVSLVLIFVGVKSVPCGDGSERKHEHAENY